jgi:EAL domain-containing protein (putative c-di-GMP-specific phosphodiesterase class I)
MKMQPYAHDLKGLQINWGSNMTRLSSSVIQLPSQTQRLLLKILELRQLKAVFQPIVHLAKNEIYSHEGLIRGPENTSLHSPLALFESARKHNLGFEMEHLSRQIVLESFAASNNPFKLFINVSPESLIEPRSCKGATLAYIQKLGLDPTNVIIELTESSPTYDYDLLRKATDHYRSLGFEIAIDDLGEGFSSLRLWSELSPEYVKIDKHFITDIDQSPVKLEFVRSIAQIAKNCGSKVIAEGIETQAQLTILKDLDITYGQGFFLGKPQAAPLNDLTLT